MIREQVIRQLVNSGGTPRRVVLRVKMNVCPASDDVKRARCNLLLLSPAVDVSSYQICFQRNCGNFCYLLKEASGQKLALLNFKVIKSKFDNNT